MTRLQTITKQPKFRNPMGVISDLINGGIKGIGEGVASVIGAINAPKEEKEKAAMAIQAEINRHTEAVLAQAADLDKAYLASIASAQDMNVKIQSAEKASWMSKNVAYLIDIFVTLLWGSLTAYLMAIMLHFIERDSNADYTAVTAVWGAVTGVFTQVLSFHRGSSQGSTDKQKMIDRLVNK